MQIVSNPQMPVARGHYSHCIEHQGVLYIAGQLPLDPVTRFMPEGITLQTQQVLNNLETILLAAGSHRNLVISVRIYVTRIEDWDEVNRVYAEYFAEHRPVRAVIPCNPLHFNALLELEAIAVAGSSNTIPASSESPS